MAETLDQDVAIVTSVTVPLSRDEAFRLFTDGMASWWPLATHSVHGAEATSVVIEPRVGGRFYEATADGRQSDWGRVTAWEPGTRLATTWHPGEPEDQATQLEVTFADVAAGATEVRLTHTGWEARGDEGRAMRDDYASGWDGVLGRFVAAAKG